MKTWFPSSYKEARRAFVDVATSSAARMSSYVLPRHRGAEGESLAVDVATFGSATASKALFITTGIHGLEGPPGSAVLNAFADQLDTLPSDVQVVAVHALNPWGYSHASRTNEDNVDVNRNFVDFSEPLPGNPAYAQLHSLLCPSTWTDDASIALTQSARQLSQQLGVRPVLDAISGGQYDTPLGLSFGGTNRCWSNRVLKCIVADYLRGCRQVIYIDWHSGFGAYGELFHISPTSGDPEDLQRMASWWGAATVGRNAEAIEGANGATPSWRGPMTAALPLLLPKARVLGTVIELGTFSNQDVLEGLMIDRWLRFGADNKSSLDRSALEERKRHVFSPRDAKWQATVLKRGLMVQQQALEGLAKW